MPPPKLSHSALLVINMQNDLASEAGAAAKLHGDPAQLAQTVAWVVSAARQQGRPVIWVVSAYGEVEATGDALGGETHTGAPCCVRGTRGAELVAPLLAIAEEHAGEPRVEKRWYSAFRDTELHARLQAERVSEVVLCGVSTNQCVLATARAARQLGYAVTVLDDATTAATSSKHARAVRDVAALGGRCRAWGELLSEPGEPVHVTGIGAGGSALWCGALRSCITDDATTYDALDAEVAWTTMWHRGGQVPRRVAIQGLRTLDGAEPLYRHPADAQPALSAYTPVVDTIRRAVELRVGHPLNHCLLQLYRDGRDWISEHADKTLDLVRPSTIVNVSLGQRRTMVLRAKRGAGTARASQKVPLPHGSFLVMDLDTNRSHCHAIRQQHGDDDGPRISLTFRYIGTFWAPESDAVWGVGAPAADRKEAEARARARHALAPEDRERVEGAEAERMLHLFRAENLDPGFDADQYRPGFEVRDVGMVDQVA